MMHTTDEKTKNHETDSTTLRVFLLICVFSLHHAASLQNSYQGSNDCLRRYLPSSSTTQVVCQRLSVCVNIISDMDHLCEEARPQSSAASSLIEKASLRISEMKAEHLGDSAAAGSGSARPPIDGKVLQLLTPVQFNGKY
ncbi:Hypothetical protein SMAX5B_009248 [Scophthalmus maximus]|uniref:Uncharacterized protein n=1 Tax=Scophthalmus maximus TaxID=52904 RepID=A0A2U9C1M0_SCOMX|nr:Hypothetical protein SMAX5B_009248 [Scophthalmus maximus]